MQWMNREDQIMAEISFDFNRTKGAVKPMHGVGQPPLLGIDTQYFKYAKEKSGRSRGIERLVMNS